MLLDIIKLLKSLVKVLVDFIVLFEKIIVLVLHVFLVEKHLLDLVLEIIFVGFLLEELEVFLEHLNSVLVFFFLLGDFLILLLCLVS